MSSLLALAADLRQLNEMLEAGERLDQLVVTVEGTATEADIAAAILDACAQRGVARERVEQVVIVRKANLSASIEDVVPVTEETTR